MMREEEAGALGRACSPLFLVSLSIFPHLGRRTLKLLEGEGQADGVEAHQLHAPHHVDKVGDEG